jgi:hypothetical protein
MERLDDDNFTTGWRASRIVRDLPSIISRAVMRRSDLSLLRESGPLSEESALQDLGLPTAPPLEIVQPVTAEEQSVISWLRDLRTEGQQWPSLI